MKRYWKIALRTLRREKLYALLNVSGLALGLACCLMLGLYLWGELTYDRYHVNHERIYRIEGSLTYPDGRSSSMAITSSPLGPMLSEEYPDYFKAYVRFRDVSRPNPVLFRHEDQKAYWEHVYLADANVFDVFTHEIVYGDPHTALTTPGSLAISRRLAQHYFGNENPVGRRFGLKRDLTFEVVGVVKAEKYNSPRDGNRFIFFLPYAQDPNARSTRDEMLLTVRLQGRTADWAERIRKELRQIDASLPLISVTTMEEELGRALALERLIAALAGGFGLLALLLACLGLGCVASYDVARRTQEIGIRMALGAGAKDVTRLMLGETATLVLMGVAIGMGVALAATRFVASLLYGLTPDDPLTLSLAVILLLAVTALAAYLPARRAARVDPIVALRHE